MDVRLLYICVCIGLIVCVRGYAELFMPPPGSMEVPSIWHCYFRGCGLKSLGVPDVDCRVLQ